MGTICQRFDQSDTNPTFTVFYGGSLLKQSLFDIVCKRYVEFAKQRVDPVVVFDGFGNGPSTKDSTHQRWRRCRLPDFTGRSWFEPYRSHFRHWLIYLSAHYTSVLANRKENAKHKLLDIGHVRPLVKPHVQRYPSSMQLPVMIRRLVCSA